uniref:Uncharacterized protein n=1 Tax=Manihot esculenta TaxID=3983 RepID=A0A2C9UWK4_MANES
MSSSSSALRSHTSELKATSTALTSTQRLHGHHPPLTDFGFLPIKTRKPISLSISSLYLNLSSPLTDPFSLNTSIHLHPSADPR